MSELLEVKNLTKTYAEKRKQAVHALRGIDFSVKPGACLGLLGPNGAGKTTTLEIIEGLKQADAGEILLFGKPRDKNFHRHIGVLFQQTALPESLTVNDCLRLFSGLYRVKEKQLSTQKQVAMLTEMFELGKLLKRYPKHLSGGQRQRVLLAIALIHNPDILFLDEPTTGLDPCMRQHFWSLIKQIKTLGKAVVLTTHYMEEAEALCDDIAIINHGEIVAQGSPKQLLAQHFQETLVDLPHSVDETQLAKLPYTIERQESSMRITTNNIDQCINQLRDCGIRLEGIRILPPSLNELYIKLTQEPESTTNLT